MAKMPIVSRVYMQDRSLFPTPTKAPEPSSQKRSPNSSFSRGRYRKNDKAAAFMPCVLYECTSDLIVTATSPNTYELIGIRPENLVGTRALWDERLPIEDRGRLAARLNQLARAEIAFEAHKITDDRGLPVWVSHSFEKKKSSRGAMIQGCIIPLPGDFRASSLDNSIVSQFIHKIGNHFQLINLLVGSLKRNAADTRDIESLQETIDKAVDFTRSFSSFSQSLGSLSVVDLGEMLCSVANSIAPACFEKNIAVKDLIGKSLIGAPICGDGFLLEFAFESLFHNALEATESGGQIILDGSSETAGSEGGAVARIVIVDTGCGIEKAALTKIAEPFFTSKRDRDGLGLSSAIRIFELHGGTVTISSTLNQGTKVEVLLPIH